MITVTSTFPEKQQNYAKTDSFLFGTTFDKSKRIEI